MPNGERVYRSAWAIVWTAGTLRYLLSKKKTPSFGPVLICPVSSSPASVVAFRTPALDGHDGRTEDRRVVFVSSEMVCAARA